MSAAEKAFGLLKTVFTFQERLDDLGDDISSLADRVTRLAESHGALRDRVSRIEGYLQGASATATATPKKLPRK